MSGACADCGHSWAQHVTVGPCHKKSSDYGGDCFCPRFVAPPPTPTPAPAVLPPTTFGQITVRTPFDRRTMEIRQAPKQPGIVEIIDIQFGVNYPGAARTWLPREQAIELAMALLKFAFAENTMKPPVPTPAPGTYDDFPF